MDYLNGLQYCSQYRNFSEELKRLNLFWDSVSTIGLINSDLLQGQATPLLESLRETRDNFTRLQDSLLTSLVEETYHKATSELAFFAQNGIDILIRNLFERTADVGFLAVDQDVRAFLLGEGDLNESIMRTRLQAYVAKYSVYDEILILDRDGAVKAQLDPANKVKGKDIRIIQGATECEDYFEYFGHSSFYPERENSHIFASPIYESDTGDGVHLGYLLLFFKFDDEMERINAQLLAGQNEASLVLIDAENRVIASSVPELFALGSRMSDAEGTLDHPLRIEGVDYLTVTKSTQGYQGYEGLDWKGRALIPIEVALNVEFNRKHRKASQEPQLLSGRLGEIFNDSQNLSRKLRMVTVNGKSLASRLDVKTFIPILEKIQEVGIEITTIISDSISMLNQTVMTSVLSNCRLYSALAIDIMDRNLYERANDCRWWAMTPSFRQVLAVPVTQREPGWEEKLSETLKYINGLYTVYTDLLIYNSEGQILASSTGSHETHTRLANTQLVSDALRTSTPQQYAVSQFVKSPEYADDYTYIYSAAIRDPHDRGVAGVGVVFDSRPEFTAMLEASLPIDSQGQPMSDTGGIYCRPNGEVISSTDSSFTVGDQLSLPIEISRLSAGESYQGVIELNGVRLLAGATASSGYREYKTTGDYLNPVIAIIYIRQ